jgi:hypothetical protein
MEGKMKVSFLLKWETCIDWKEEDKCVLLLPQMKGLQVFQYLFILIN